MESPRSVMLNLKVAATERERIHETAAARGVSTSEFIRQALAAAGVQLREESTPEPSGRP